MATTTADNAVTAIRQEVQGAFITVHAHLSDILDHRDQLAPDYVITEAEVRSGLDLLTQVLTLRVRQLAGEVADIQSPLIQDQIREGIDATSGTIQVRYTKENAPAIAESFASLQPEVAITGVERAGDALSHGIQELNRNISGVQWEVFLENEVFGTWDNKPSSKDPIQASKEVAAISGLLSQIGTAELTREDVVTHARDILANDSPHKAILMKALTLKAFIAGGYRVDIELPDENGTYRPWGGPDGRNELTEAVQASLREHGALELLC
ncbi:hypothetical protein KC660_00875, partial [Candidatus Dojkabacteria bacterium]|nr:hypothetical protein [Candidatus Dojkabacteria bacterium]